MPSPDLNSIVEIERTKRVLRWIIWPSYGFILGGGAVFLLAGISLRPELTLLWHGGGFLLVAVAHFLMKRGKIWWSADLMIVLFFFIYTSAAGLSGGTTSPYMGGFLLVVVGAGVLRGGRAALIAAGASILMGTFFVVLDGRDQLPLSLMPMTPAFNMVAWTLIYGMAGVMLHVTLGELYRALKRAQGSEGALAEALEDLHRTSVSKESVESVLLGLGDAVFVLDAESCIREVNPRAETMLGRTSEELSGMEFEALVKGLPPLGGKSEGILRTATGIVHVSMSRAPIYGMRGQVDGVLVVAHDIDARVAAEEKIKQVAVMAEQASSAKSTFLATMSHELRTPLNAIIGYAEFVQEELDGLPGLADDVGRIERSGRDLLGLINDILDLSKIEAGRIELEIRPTDLDALIHDTAEQIRPLMYRNGNALEVDAVDLGWVRTDPTRIRQILRNLLSNAAKFTESGTITLRARTSSTEIRLSVQDTGLGMTEEQVARVWEPFTQADASTTRRFGGTGLGLPITQHLCELLGGGISVQSSPGVGTTFELVLPTLEDSHDER